MKSKIANIIATYLGCGLSKFAPGTVGSLGTLPLAYLIMYYGNFYILLSVAVVLFFIGAKATEIVSKESGNEDPSKVVIDETVGQLLTFSIVAFLAQDYLVGSDSILFYICGFVFFRFFDILKMGPVKYADTKIKNAYGVMLDDVFAGLFASVVLLLVLFVKINL